MVAQDAAYQVSIFEEVIEDLWTQVGAAPTRRQMETACANALNSLYGYGNTADRAQGDAQRDVTITPD